MDNFDKPLLDVLRNKEPLRPPVWLMRQAGRYLPEYREIRAKSKNFLTLCLTPELAAEVTLQPIRRFDLDAAIIFADILLIPYALGAKLDFIEGEGPRLEPLQETGIDKLFYEDDKISAVYDSLRRVKSALPDAVSLIGFCGAPWTVACYMIDGHSRDGFQTALSWAQSKPDQLDRLMDKLIEASTLYLGHQIEAGAEALQIFDSWAGLLQNELFERWIIRPTQKLVRQVKARHPHIPIIGFPREARDGYLHYAQQAGIDALSIDQHVDVSYAKSTLRPLKPLQGNLAPEILVAGGEAMKNALNTLLKTFGTKHIYNLGHGIVPQTPPEHVAALVEQIRNHR
jgi:uroporphyrinogen decarboxylase